MQVRRYLLSSAFIGLTFSITTTILTFGSDVAQAEIIFDYGGTGNGLVYNTPRPTTAADIGTLPTLPAGQAYQVNTITVAYANNTGASGSVDVGLFLWQNVDTTAPAGTSIFSNLLTSTVFNRNGFIIGAFINNITFLPGALTLQGGQTFGYQMVYAAPGTINMATASYTPNTAGVGGFYTGRGAGGTLGPGDSANGFYSNSNTSGLVQASDLVVFGAPNAAMSNVYLRVDATVISVTVPEPSSIAFIFLGCLPMIGGAIHYKQKQKAY